MRTFPVILSLLVLAAIHLNADTYTYPDLVQRLTDLDLLAQRPPAGEKTGLASSYDRHSQYDAVHDKYILWGANGDGDGFVRKEGDKTVFADITGPGCIVRMWSADPRAGHVKIYLDGNEVPAVDLPFSAYFDGTTKPFNRPGLVYNTAPGQGPNAGGSNNFTPISFQKSCKIVADPNWGRYFQFTYTQFPEGTKVPTFHLDLSPTDSAALDSADKVLSQCGQNPAGTRPAEKTEKVSVDAAPGKTTQVIQLSGPEAITALRVKFDVPTDPDAAFILLRQLAIQITWDDDKTAAVWSPLGDFFATICSTQTLQNLPMGQLADGTFYSYWYMPFATKAKIEIINDSGSPVSMAWEISHAPLTSPLADLDRFHAKWHRDAFLPERPDRAPDWTLLTTQGTGRFVGTQLHVWNPRGGWWGEGDDKFFVDGEKFPSSFGTGSEDYFGAAWGLKAPFGLAFHGIALTEGDGVQSSVHRWHIPDSVPFQTSFEGIIEKYFSNEQPTVYAAVAYWYLDPKGTDPYPALPVGDLVDYRITPPVFHEPGAIEGEDMPVLKVEPENSTRRHDAVGYGYPVMVVSGDKLLSWGPRTVGQHLELGFKVATAGKYHLIARFLRGPNNGIYQAALDGRNLGSPIDLYAPRDPKFRQVLADPLDLGLCDLTAGDHVLSFQLSGLNAAAKANGGGFVLFSLDYIKVIP